MYIRPNVPATIVFPVAYDPNDRIRILVLIFRVLVVRFHVLIFLYPTDLLTNIILYTYSYSEVHFSTFIIDVYDIHECISFHSIFIIKRSYLFQLQR